MFTQATPILAADDQHGIDAEAVLARFEALGVVTAVLARISGNADADRHVNLADHADLASAVAAMPCESARRVVTECDSIAMALNAGLIALDKARRAGRMNPSAAELLYDEANAALSDLRMGILRSRWN